MKYRLLIALIVCVWVPFLIMFRGSATPSITTLSAAPAAETSGPSLRSLAQKRGIGFGTSVDLGPFLNDPNYRQVLAREFQILVPENAWKFEFVHPNRDRYEFGQVDTLINFAKDNNMEVRGHPLVWHYSLPKWINEGNFSRDELIDILRTHVKTLVGRYRGQIPVWDVVNEAINRDGSLRDTIWLRNIGPEYIDMAFQWAHEADPQAKLFYGEYMTEEINQKSDGVYTLVSGLLQRGVPIDGIGFQSHLGLSYLPRLDSLAQNFDRFNQLGLEVQFTELDMKIQDGKGSLEERLAKQAKAYSDLLKVCLQAKKCTALITWGFTDRYTWIADVTGEVEAPLIFDASYRPKPAYNALKEVLSSSK
ncbi:endo-1,4-beta-xylanase [Microcoleus sp. FACHB-53]|nr:endo-1,4-beta-xylanase [Microcoleus sp. FACHB-53]MBD2125618.1 endo-1,4-beta-xylanase [Microcoleus sp. FACHB-1]